jgi:small subunit ribosomal protein S20
MEVLVLANIKSAKKRILVNQKSADRNKSIRSGVKTAMKKVFVAVESGNEDIAKKELQGATKVIEMAGSKGVFHKNNVARKVSRVTKAVNEMAKKSEA